MRETRWQMLCAPDSVSSGQGSSPVRVCGAVVLGKTLHSQSSTLHSSVWMGTGEFTSGGNLKINSHFIQGRGRIIEILLVASR